MMSAQTIPPFEDVLKLLETPSKPEEDLSSMAYIAKNVRKSRLDWSASEKATLFEKHRELGNKWTTISKFLPNKTENIIKNFFYSSLRKLCRKVKKGILPKYNDSKARLTQDQVFHLLDYIIEIFSPEGAALKCKRRDSYLLGMLDTKELSTDMVVKYKAMLTTASSYSTTKFQKLPCERDFLEKNPALIPMHTCIQKKLSEVNMFLINKGQLEHKISMGFMNFISA